MDFILKIAILTVNKTISYMFPYLHYKIDVYFFFGNSDQK